MYLICRADLLRRPATRLLTMPCILDMALALALLAATLVAVASPCAAFQRSGNLYPEQGVIPCIRNCDQPAGSLSLRDADVRPRRMRAERFDNFIPSAADVLAVVREEARKQRIKMAARRARARAEQSRTEQSRAAPSCGCAVLA